MRVIWPAVIATILIQADGASAQDTRPDSRATRSNPGAYVLGKVTRTGLVRGRLHAEFGINKADGLRAGERLIVIRPTAGNVVVDEIEVEIVDDRQAVGRCAHPRGVEPDDVAIFQRTLNLDIPLAANARPSGDLYAEITFWSPPRGETRTTFNARLQKITWEGMIDIRDLEAVVIMDGLRSARMTIPAASIKQMRLNGIVLVIDGPKKTLVAAAVHDYREVVRADAAQRERIEIARARIASEERVRIASAQADADARVRIAAAKARTESDERIRMAEMASQERVELARLERNYAYARERIAAHHADSSQGLNRALTAAGGLLQIGAYFFPEHADSLGGLAGGAASLQAIIQ